MRVSVCVCVCWHSAKGTETHTPHTSKAILSNHDLPLQPYGQMYPGEDVKDRMDFLSEKGHGLWAQTDQSSYPSSVTY